MLSLHLPLWTEMVHSPLKPQLQVLHSTPQHKVTTILGGERIVWDEMTDIDAVPVSLSIWDVKMFHQEHLRAKKLLKQIFLDSVVVHETIYTMIYDQGLLLFIYCLQVQEKISYNNYCFSSVFFQQQAYLMESSSRNRHLFCSWLLCWQLYYKCYDNQFNFIHVSIYTFNFSFSNFFFKQYST